MIRIEWLGLNVETAYRDGEYQLAWQVDNTNVDPPRRYQLLCAIDFHGFSTEIRWYLVEVNLPIVRRSLDRTDVVSDSE